MATTITFNTSSPHSLVLTASGTGGTVSVARAAVLAACQEGPLKALLTRVPDWTIFNLGDIASYAVHVREVFNRAGAGEATPLQFTWEAAGIQADSTATAQLEIRLNHTSRL